MKKPVKFVALAIAMAFCFSLVACASSKAPTENTMQTQTSTSSTAVAETSEDQDAGKINQDYLPSGDAKLPQNATMNDQSEDKHFGPDAEAHQQKYVDEHAENIGTWYVLTFEGKEYIYAEDEFDSFSKEWKAITGSDTRFEEN